MKRITRFVAMGGMAVAALLCGTAQGAVYDETTGYVRLLVSGNAGFSPLSETTDKNDGKTYFWSDHLALHSGTNYYANKFFRSWSRTDGQAAMELNLDCGRFVLDNQINWKCAHPSRIVFGNDGLFVLAGSLIIINQDNVLLGGIGGTVTLQGTTQAKPFTWQTSTAGYPTIGHGFWVTAKIVGDVDQIMRITTPADSSGRVYFMGDMSEYLGTINTISNILYAGTSLAAKDVNATKCGEVRAHGADGAEGRERLRAGDEFLHGCGQDSRGDGDADSCGDERRDAPRRAARGEDGGHGLAEPAGVWRTVASRGREAVRPAEHDGS